MVFNEIMYHPAADQGGEWIELSNQMVVNMDLSGWSLDEAVTFDFPPNTVIPGGGRLVIAEDPTALQAATGFSGALGPWEGQLDNGGERLVLRNNNDRLMDEVLYDDRQPWPVAPDGSGVSLAKIAELTPSGPVANWAPSTQLGGTPGIPNFASNDPIRITETLLDSGVPATAFVPSGGALAWTWTETNFNDDAWLQGTTGVGYDEGLSYNSLLGLDLDAPPPVFIGLSFRGRFLGWRHIDRGEKGVRFRVRREDLVASLGRLRFRVVWGDTGRPAADAEAHIWESLADYRAYGVGFMLKVDGSNHRLLSSKRGDVFDERYLIPAEYVLHVTLGRSVSVRRIVRIDPGRTTDLGDLVLRRLRPIEVTVVDQHGRPIEGMIHVGPLASGHEPEKLLLPHGSLTDLEGRARIPCPSGRSFMVVEYLEVETTLRSNDGFPPRRLWSRCIVIDPTRPPSTLSIIVESPSPVTLHSTAPASEARLRLVNDLGLIIRTFGAKATIATDLIPGTYRVQTVTGGKVVTDTPFEVRSGRANHVTVR